MAGVSLVQRHTGNSVLAGRSLRPGWRGRRIMAGKRAPRRTHGNDWSPLWSVWSVRLRSHIAVRRRDHLRHA